jgi:hypothetical protein
VRITLDDGSTTEIPSEVLILHRRVTVRKKVRQIVQPLSRQGVEKLEFRADDEVTVTVGPDDVQAYEVEVDEPTTLLDQESESLLEIRSVQFTEGNKWSFSDGQANFSAALEDFEFVQRVKNGEPFSSGDMLRCRVRVVQNQDEGGKLHTERYITEVIKHIRSPRPEQLRLDPPAGDGL